MVELKDILSQIRARHGNKSQVARMLGIYPQLLGQYERGERKPKKPFYDKWKEVFNEDLEAMKNEANVSREAQKPTPVQIEPAVAENSQGRIYKELYEKFLGNNSEYLFLHKDVLKDHRLVSIDQIEQDRALHEQRSKELQMLTEAIREIAMRPIQIQLPDIQGAKK